MIVLGLTGGIASGKTTITNFVKKKNIPVHDSDKFVSGLYKNPTKKFLKYLKSIKLNNTINKNVIDKNKIRKLAFSKKGVLKKLEKFIHKEAALSRKYFLAKNKRCGKKIVVLDIPLLFENKLEKICDYVMLAYCPDRIRKQRALKRKNINKKILKKIMSLQLPDTIKIIKSDFIILTSIKKSYSDKQVSSALRFIKLKSKK